MTSSAFHLSLSPISRGRISYHAAGLGCFIGLHRIACLYFNKDVAAMFTHKTR